MSNNIFFDQIVLTKRKITRKDLIKKKTNNLLCIYNALSYGNI